MEEKHYELSVKYMELGSQVKDAICKRMKELGCIKFNRISRKTYPFLNVNGEFVSVNVVKLIHDAEYFDDATAIDEYGNEWSVQEEGTVDGCMELLYYIEQEEYEVIKE